MTDRELLEWAAKAAGMNPTPSPWGVTLVSGGGGPAGKPYWNPLADDGDALRLAMQLDLMIHIRGGGTLVRGPGADAMQASETWEPQGKAAATRRAIVVCAAWIGGWR